MNRGDFGHVNLPKTLRIVAAGKYKLVNGYASAAATGFALSTFTSAPPAALNFTVPKDVLDQLKNEGLVTATTIDLYDAARNPSSSPANMTRYLSLLQRLATVEVSDDT